MELPLLIFSTTKKDSDLRYLVGTHIPDDIALVYEECRSIVLASALEINRLKTTSRIKELVAWEEIKRSLNLPKTTDLDILNGFLKKIGLKKFSVKRDFPVYLADQLRANGFEIHVSDSQILPQRLLKSEYEVTEIQRCAEIVKSTIAEVEIILSNSSINAKNELVWDNETLTSERLRKFMEDFSYGRGAMSEYTIISCSPDSCDPHNIGYGPILANELIIIDFFPYLKSSGYYADVSRTFIKGKPSSEQRKLYNAVKFAHDMAIEMAHNDVPVSKLMEAVFRYFESQGFQSSKISNPPHGMFHGLGHGLGLDIHESPRIGICDDILKSGMVVTIEPGLYYREIGGVRIEDDILIHAKSSEVLTKIPYNWVID